MHSKKDRGNKEEKFGAAGTEKGFDFYRFAAKNWHYGVLILIIILGIFLRSYHLDYPLVDYHNMKEAHTLMETKHFYDGDGLFTNRYDYLVSIENPKGIHSDNFPLLGWTIALIWKITGVDLVVPRVIMVFLSAVIIFFTYLVVMELFNNKRDLKYLALLSAFFIASCPVFVFFGRRVFYDIPALAFAMVGLYYFLLWRREPKSTYFILFVVMTTLAALSKMVYLIFLFPIAAIFPYSRFFSKEGLKRYYKQYLFSIILPLSLWLYTILSNNGYSGGLASRLFEGNADTVMTAGYWKTLYMFATVENFTTFGFYLMVLGLAISVFYINKEWSRFLIAWMLSIIPYAFITGWMFTGHNYYQIPFVPVVCILMAFAVWYVLNTAVPKFKQDWLKRSIVVAVVIILLAFIYFPKAEAAIDRQFDTQFYGLDIAGEFIKGNSGKDERIFGSGHQDTAMYWYAERSGVEVPGTLEEFRKLESGLNFKWVFVYQWGLETIPAKKEVWGYICDNYRMRQLGILQPNSGNPAIFYIILEKGGTFNEAKLNDYISNLPLQTKKYEVSKGDVEFGWFDIL